MFNFFDNIPSEYLIYFLYGSAFLFLSFAIWIKDMKGSDLKIADTLRLLALFGLTHGVHELLELYPLIEGDHLSLLQIFHVKLFSLVILVLSFFFLLQFGLLLTRTAGDSRPFRSAAIFAALLAAWSAFMAHHGFAKSLRFLGQAEIGARYTFCLAGSFMTAYGLITYSRSIKVLSPSVARHFRYAGFTFVLYGLFAGVFVTRISVIALPFHIELLRGLSAISITFFIIKALNIFDVETRKRIEVQTRRLLQTEKLTSLGQLAAGIAHEINNPLTNASLGIQRLKLEAGDVETDVVERLDAVERNIDKASSIARELLKLSRQQEPEFVPLEINSVVSGTLTLMKHKLEAVKLRQTLSPVSTIMGDAGKLEQVFINILSNSLEAMPEGGIIAIATSQSNEHVRVVIEDNGIGIPEKNVSRIFDPFFTTKEVGAGTGLGLSICYAIIKQHHGAIEFESEPGRGTRVTVRIPTKERYEKDTYRR